MADGRGRGRGFIVNLSSAVDVANCVDRLREIPLPLRSLRARLKTGGQNEPQRLVLALAGHIIHKADREHPADALLRHELMAQRRFAQDFKAQVSRAVLAYYRWRGWLDLNEPSHSQIKQALELAEQFADRPARF